MHLDIYYVSTMYTMHVCIYIYDVSMYIYIYILCKIYVAILVVKWHIIIYVPYCSLGA